jgi:hypothetical protein
LKARRHPCARWAFSYGVLLGAIRGRLSDKQIDTMAVMERRACTQSRRAEKAKNFARLFHSFQPPVAVVASRPLGVIGKAVPDRRASPARPVSRRVGKPESDERL